MLPSVNKAIVKKKITCVFQHKKTFLQQLILLPSVPALAWKLLEKNLKKSTILGSQFDVKKRRSLFDSLNEAFILI